MPLSNWKEVPEVSNLWQLKTTNKTKTKEKVDLTTARINIRQSHFWSSESVKFNIQITEQSYFWSFECVKYPRCYFCVPCQRTLRLEMASSFDLQWHGYVCLLRRGKKKRKLITDSTGQGCSKLQLCYSRIGLDDCLYGRCRHRTTRDVVKCHGNICM